ncbi:DNA polymerase alpha catalytic subunit [Golovinomyces cichoracearum]|uniref:DNA polymerase n=1 Tax=Golovinomyces cichoracearum TaxID=62708 RepID=A0A420J2F8_9PEZI|nr:DNA polymerase alpha catalytic subunit [Golovinomyces cichoracearum]
MPNAVNQRARFAELRALRESGKKRLETYEIHQQEDIYEEVDEDNYKKVVRARLNEDDFVIDDNGEGYVDDGREEWGQGSPCSSDQEGIFMREELRIPGDYLTTNSKDQEEKAKQEKGISDYFSKGTAPSQIKTKYTTSKADEDFLAQILTEVDTNPPQKNTEPNYLQNQGEKRRLRELSPSTTENLSQVHKKIKFVDTRATTPPDIKDTGSQGLKIKVETSPTLVDDLQIPSNVLTAHLKDFQPNKVEVSPTLVDDLQLPSNVPTAHLKDFQPNKVDFNNAVEEDGSLLFFWTDYIESNGSLCLFGKVRNKKSGSYASTFIKIDNIFRKLFFLPRQNRQGSTDEITMEDVYKEVDALMTSLKVDMHKIKMCERKYAFELPNIPREGQYLKLMYPYYKPQLQLDHQSGSTYAHVFGINTPLFEQFVLWKNIMGPCWLKIENPEFGILKHASHCRLEVQISKPNLIKPVSESEIPDILPLTFMSIVLRTALNVKENKREIIAISARTYQDLSLTDTTPPEKLPCQSITVLRPFFNQFPIGLEALISKHTSGQVKLVKHERELLGFFLDRIALNDPDVILGHQLEGFDLSILLSRLQANKTSQWSRLGRMKRTQWPYFMGNTEGNLFAERSVLSGRLMCDLANDMGKSMMTKCTSWSLTEMCSIYLNDTRRRDIDSEQALKTWATTNNGIMDYIRHCEADTFFISALAFKIQMLPLTKILTNLAGNSWARTLTGTRAERNEYILLHEFYKNKYICPDKAIAKSRYKFENENFEDGREVTKKDKYKGGLVFEPEKGLYDKFVLVMDFNSLYPSIIQEFNICFTTVLRENLSENDEKIPEVPRDQEPGILPKLIATLVNRRRQVKNLMKDRKATDEQLATWEIKQLALKLTANSMYGCLGYTKSRFYARPLAVLTTYKGREILRSTKDLAESNSLQVIYGDTDSVMINANVNNVEDAIKVGKEFKKAVNDRYKLLEIDIDNIFKRILLQAKKKYAAINLVPVDNRYVEKMEIKGLDMVRREYCNLSKEVCSKILNEILSGDDSEVVVSRIHKYLSEISEKMRNGNVLTNKYTIYTKLGKAPKDYPNADNMPQVQVAFREISKGKVIRKDDVIAYIVTGDSKTSSESIAKRSYSPQDVSKVDSNLTPDIDWYLHKQILPPVERLCANISGTDTVRLADCLGLDVRRYRISNNNSNGCKENEIHPLESQIDDEIRFRDASRLTLFCRKCKEKFLFEGLQGSLRNCSPSGIVCHCGYNLPDLSIMSQLEHQIRRQSSKYYEGWLVCDDQACGIRTRQMSVYGHRCLGPQTLARNCLGKMRYEYTEKMIYNQLLYFASLFDVDKAKTPKEPHDDKVSALVEHNRTRFTMLKLIVEKYLDKCGRQWVDMGSIFGRIGSSS